MTDCVVKDVAVDLQIVWTAFKRLEAVWMHDPDPVGVFGDACLETVMKESQTHLDFDAVHFATVVNSLKDLLWSVHKPTKKNDDAFAGQAEGRVLLAPSQPPMCACRRGA